MTHDAKPRALDAVDPALILDLDVRPDLRAGKEPFQRIMHAKAAVADGGVLRLRALFEPRPLYDVLAQDGFRHWTEELAPDDWRIWFWRESGTSVAGDAMAGSAARPCGCSGPSAHASPPPTPTCGGREREGPADVHPLDVRGLEPPEPMVRTLEALESLPSEHTLLQLNDRVPRFLLPELDARGFQWQFLDEEPGQVRLAIRRSGELPVLDVRLLPSPRKHPEIFRAFDALEPGEAFVLLNDHDPVPLRYQFQAERTDAFTWSYLESGPTRFRVRIGRTA